MMDPTTCPQAIRIFVEATNAGDTDAFVPAFAPGARLDDWGASSPGGTASAPATRRTTSGSRHTSNCSA